MEAKQYSNLLLTQKKSSKGGQQSDLTGNRTSKSIAI